MPKQKYPIHKDFAHFPAMPFPIGKIITPMVNKFLHFDTWRSQRDLTAKAIKHQVKVSDGASVEVLQFNPDTASSETLPAMLYFHGGAFALTYASTHVASMDWYANELGIRVFMVDYRLMPKHVFPTGFNDCYDTLVWMDNNAEKLAIDKEKIILAGDSAGGAMAASVAQRANDTDGPKAIAQLLIYPVTDSSCSTESAKTLFKTPLFDAAANKKMWQVYISDYKNPPPYASPIHHKNLSGLPPAFVDNAEFDPLRDEGANYAKALEQAGVDVELHESKGTIHGYDTVLESKITQETLQKRMTFLRKVLG